MLFAFIGVWSQLWTKNTWYTGQYQVINSLHDVTNCSGDHFCSSRSRAAQNLWVPKLTWNTRHVAKQMVIAITVPQITKKKKLKNVGKWWLTKKKEKKKNMVRDDIQCSTYEQFYFHPQGQYKGITFFFPPWNRSISLLHARISKWISLRQRGC